MVKINDVKFSDIYITPDRIAFIPDGQTKNGLTILDAEDFDIFYKRLEEKWDGHNPSYSLLYENIFYRVERTEACTAPSIAPVKCRRRFRLSGAWVFRTN